MSYTRNQITIYQADAATIGEKFVNSCPRKELLKAFLCLCKTHLGPDPQVLPCSQELIGALAEEEGRESPAVTVVGKAIRRRGREMAMQTRNGHVLQQGAKRQHGTC